MKKHLSVFVVPYLVSCLSSLASAASVLPSVELLPFAFAGRIVDYAHTAFDAETVAEVRVKAKDGALLAKTTTVSRNDISFNYAVFVPVASRATAGHAQVGEEVVFEFVDGDGRIFTGLVPSERAKVGSPGQYAQLDVILATDANGDGVADEYVETLEYMMWLNGIAEYDAKADYDRDGASNYAEYVAGTNPFDATDRFSVREMAAAQGYGDYMALKVLVAQGRSYTVQTTGALGRDVTDWASTQFSVSDPSAALQDRLSTGSFEQGYRVFYVKKDGASRFWQLKVE